MSKRKGPFLINDLTSKLEAAPVPTRPKKSEADTDHARNAYEFITKNYKNTASKPVHEPNSIESEFIEGTQGRSRLVR